MSIPTHLIRRIQNGQQLPYDRKEPPMRFMVMVKATADSEAGVMPSEEMLASMGRFNEELVKAGVLLDGAGLQPSSKGARIRFSGGKTTVMIESVAGMISAPPIPMSARVAMSASGLEASAASPDPRPKITRPENSARRRPKRSPRAPIVSSNPAKTSR